LQINLPSATADKQPDRPVSINVAVDARGHYTLNNAPVAYSGVEGLSAELKRLAGNNPEQPVIINADASATHQAVVNVMEAARLAGLSRITFATQSQSDK